MMKFLRTFLTVAFLFVLKGSHAQYFEGKLTYQITYEYKSEKSYLRDVEEREGNRVEYYIKNGNYKVVRYFHDMLVSVSIYSPSENRVYTEEKKSKYLQWQDCSYEKDSLENIFLSHEKLRVNNFDCQTLTQISALSTNSYAVTSQLKIDPQSFKDHALGFWNRKLEAVDGGLDVMMIHETEDYISTWNLVDVEEILLTAETWEINRDKIAIPNPREHTSSPEVAGGYKSFYKCISTHLKYPRTARRSEAQGRVYVQFLVNEDGSVSDVEVVKSVHPEIDAEAMKGIRECSKKWTPAYINDRPVKSPMVLPITFKL